MGDFDRYFSEFLAARMNQLLLPDVRKLTATFRVVPRDRPEQHWAVDIRDGMVRSINANAHTYQCTFIVDRAAFGEIVAGRLNAQQAFFDRRIDIEGDVEVGLRLTVVLSAFFRKHPFGPGRVEGGA